MTNRIAATLLTAVVALLASEAFSQDYPTRPVRIVTSAIGGAADFTSRQIAQGIAAPLGQPVVVDNRAAVQAIEAVVKATPDGYTVLITSSNLWIGPLLKEATYDPVKDFLPVSLANRAPLLFVANPSLPAKTVKELIALGKAKPGAINYASQSTGGGSHLSMELFKSMAGVNFVRIVYKGGAAAITDLIGGDVQVAMNDVSQLLPHVKLGKLRGLAVTSAEPSALAPGVPTVAASGLPGYEAVTMTGMVAPAKTPASVVTRLNQEVVRVLSRSEVKELFLAAGVESVASSPQQFTATMKDEMSRISKMIKDVGIRGE